MTDREKAIVMTYTGSCMLSGDKFQIFHKYVEDIMGRPVYTHELADDAVVTEIKEKAKADFIALCAEQEPKTGEWQQDLDGTYLCSECGSGFKEQPTLMGKPMFLWCPLCGAKMESEARNETDN